MENEILKQLGNNIKKERLKQNLSQENLANIAEINTRSISTLESGKNNIRFETIYKIASALNTKMTKIVKVGGFEMLTNFEKVKNYVLELGYPIVDECKDEEILVITAESYGLKKLIIDCEEPIVVIEQFIFRLKSSNPDVLKRLMQINRELVHGAFVLDEEGTKVIFRDTLRLETLDLEELESSIDSLIMAMAEYSNELINFAKEIQHV